MSDLSVSLPVSFPGIRPRDGRLRLSLSGRVGRFLLGVGGLGILLAVWWLFTGPLAAEGSFSRRFAPGLALTSLIEMGWHGDLLTHVWLSLKRVLVGLVVALAVGVPLGLAVGSLRVVEAATSPVFQFLRMISPLSWMPVAVMVLGVGDAPIYFLLSFAAVWPILLSTADGVKQLDRRWLLLAQSLAATRWETLTRIVLPGVLAPVLTGVRLAIGVLWIVLVPAEMLGVAGGLGYLVLDTRDRMAYGELTAVVLVIGLLGFLLDAIARFLYRMRTHG
ncbi:ABC transporter permease protein [Granulibacter bethesdensis]|uniref:ABC transporter permease protein n=1 Tax=Granulibacter bethesdensis TaxID=364410 RepID=A0AAC9P9I4_9PROT|nr:ABC transporter permease [Granulibacter bethesdensis]APH55626.1 ABC transporter permease protein [Granulibacter bethesdensis]APH63211.1 ABC transporter permease protein [Granulibacter bethesdensis]